MTRVEPMRGVYLAILTLLLAGPVVASDGADNHDVLPLRVQLLYGELVGLETRSAALTFETFFDQDDRRPRRHDPWLAFDKVQHFTFSALFTVGGQYALVNKFSLREGQALPISMFTSFTIGLTKELYDWQAGPRQYFSWRDMTANGVGILVAAGFILL
jgi:putative lipoprotein